MDTLEIIRDIMKRKHNKEHVELHSTMKDLGVDSLDLVEVVLEVEELLGISFEDEELVSMKTIQNVVDTINRKR